MRLTRKGSSQRRYHPGQKARFGCLSPRPLQRAFARLQGRRAPAPRQSLRVRAGQARQAGQRGRRHLRGHRIVRRVRPARQEERTGLHAFAARPHERVPGGPDVLAAGRQHLQHRGARRVRRLPGHRQGDLGRFCVQGEASDRRGQLDQLGPGRGSGRVLLQGVFRRGRGSVLRRAFGQLRQRLRRARGTQHGTSHQNAHRRHQRETTCSTSSSEPGATACARPRR